MENEGNEYPVADPSKMISISNELSEVLKEMLIEDLRKNIVEELQEKLKENMQKQLKE
jgi:hypothetical protein